MKHNYILLLLPAILWSCSGKPLNVKIVGSDASQLMIVDEAKVSDTRDIRLSDIASDFRVVRFDNREEALFRPGMLSFSDNYIIAGKEPVKLFDRDGRYICDVGAIGNEPGEYPIGAYDVLIDEEGGQIYVAGFNNKINSYDLQGNFTGEAKIGRKLNKGKLFKNADATISTVQLCFSEQDDNQFVAATFPTSMNDTDTVSYVFSPYLVANLVDDTGATVGFNNEIFSYRCTDTPTFHTTFNDTLYNYNAEANRLEAVYTLDMDIERKDGAFFVYYDLPHHMLTYIVGGANKGKIMVDKSTREAWRVGKCINDFFFNLDGWGWSMHDGYVYGIYEPLELKSRLEDAIADGKIGSEHHEAVERFMTTLHENDNNVMIVAKLRS